MTRRFCLEPFERRVVPILTGGSVKDVRSILATTLSILLAMPAGALAASHREAPLTALDHAADITDFYAFRSYDDPTKVTFILDVDPLLEPANGPNYFPFDPSIVYAIHI